MHRVQRWALLECRRLGMGALLRCPWELDENEEYVFPVLPKRARARLYVHIVERT